MGKTRTASQPTPKIALDNGALVALDKGNRRMIALLDQGSKAQVQFYLSAGVLGQAWRNGQRQANIARLLRLSTIVTLDEDLARKCGELCGATATSDVIDASVVIVARTTGCGLILTSDPQDLLRLDPTAIVELI